MQLPEAQVAVLEAASANEARTIDAVADEVGETPTVVTRAAFELEEADLLAVEAASVESVELTEEGQRYRERGLPELRLYRAALDAGAASRDGPRCLSPRALQFEVEVLE